MARTKSFAPGLQWGAGETEIPHHPTCQGYILRSFLDSTLAPADYDAFFFMVSWPLHPVVWSRVCKLFSRMPLAPKPETLNLQP